MTDRTLSLLQAVTDCYTRPGTAGTVVRLLGAWPHIDAQLKPVFLVLLNALLSALTVQLSATSRRSCLNPLGREPPIHKGFNLKPVEVCSSHPITGFCFVVLHGGCMLPPSRPQTPAGWGGFPLQPSWTKHSSCSVDGANVGLQDLQDLGQAPLCCLLPLPAPCPLLQQPHFGGEGEQRLGCCGGQQRPQGGEGTSVAIGCMEGGKALSAVSVEWARIWARAAISHPCLEQ